MRRLTLEAIAREMGISVEYLCRIRRDKTASLPRAEQVARHFGGDAEDYLRAARPRGRPKRDEESQRSFRKFILEIPEESEERSDNYDTLVWEFMTRYGGRKPTPPASFETLGHMIGFIHSADFCLECRDEALNLWKQFKIWRIQQECAERIFAVEMGDDVS